MELIRISCVLNVKPNLPPLMKVFFFLLRALTVLSHGASEHLVSSFSICFILYLSRQSEQNIIILCNPYKTQISSINLIKCVVISRIPRLCLLYIMLVRGLHFAEVQLG